MVGNFGYVWHEIKYRQGRVHNNADSLSRRQCSSEPCSHCDKKDHRFDTHCDVQTQTEMTNPETLTEICSSLSSERMVEQCNKVPKTRVRFPGNDSDGNECGVISLVD